MTKPTFWFSIAIRHGRECLNEIELSRALSRKLLSALIIRRIDESRTTRNSSCLEVMKSMSLSYESSVIRFSRVESSPGTSKFWSIEAGVECSLLSTDDTLTMRPIKQLSNSRDHLQRPIKVVGCSAGLLIVAKLCKQILKGM